MKNMKSAVKALRELPKGYPESHEGIACAGTAVEMRTFKARNTRRELHPLILVPARL